MVVASALLAVAGVLHIRPTAAVEASNGENAEEITAEDQPDGASAGETAPGVAIEKKILPEVP